MFCPFCGTDNAVDKKYCRSCGAVLPAGAKQSAKLRPAQPGQNAPSPTAASSFVPPQPPDLPNIVKAKQPDAAEASPRTAPRTPDDPFNTKPSFAVPVPRPRTSPPVASTVDFYEDEQKSEAEDLFQTKVEFRKVTRPNEGARDAYEQIPDLAETLFQNPPDLETIQMGSIPSPPPIDSNATKLMPPTPRRPPQPPPISNYDESLPTLVSPKVMRYDDQQLALDEMIRSATSDANNLSTAKGSDKKVETLESGSPVELPQFNQTLETPSLPDTGVFEQTITMEALEENSAGDLRTEAFAYQTEPHSYSPEGSVSRNDVEQVETLVFNQPKILDADKTLPADTNQLLPSPVEKTEEDLFKTKIVPQAPPRAQEPYDPFKTLPMQAVQHPLPQPLKPEFEKTLEEPVSKTEPLKPKPSFPPPIPSPMQSPAARPSSDESAVPAKKHQPFSPSSPAAIYAAPYHREAPAETEYAPPSEPEVFEEKRPRSRLPLKHIAAFVALLVVVGTASVYIFSYIKRFTTAANQPQPVVKPITPPEPSPPPANMALVPAGEYTIGVVEGDNYSTPQHTVYLNAFYIDVYEVTKEEYAKFIAETGRSAPGTWKDGKYPGKPNEPVTDVSWEDAAAYAAWAGKRLPTEEEWEAAASGKGHFRFPWGDNWDKTRANTIEYGAKSLLPVGKVADGKSSFGAMDMCGNVWEWTSSKALPYPGGVELIKSPEQPDQFRIFRGGSFKDKSTVSTTIYRNWDTTVRTHAALGFRCAKDAPR